MADEPLEQFLEAYDVHRIKDQEQFYADRVKEYVAADRQAGGLAALLLFSAGVSGVVAAAWPAYALWLGVVAAAFAATATVIGSWADLVGFSKNAQMFRAAEDRLAFARPDRPIESEADSNQVRAYVTRMEDILLGEVRAWGKEWGEPESEPTATE